jgi:hypothetical protein
MPTVHLGNTRIAFMLLSIIVLFTACGTSWRMTVEGEAKTKSVKKAPDSHHHKKAPHIPPGHMPPPGKCRIWYPDRPPGHQPPPGNCDELRRQVPPGAWLIRG